MSPSFPVFDQELGGGSGSLLEYDGTAIDDLIDDLLGIVAYGDKLEVFVVAEEKSLAKFVLELLEQYVVVVDAEGKAEGGVLHEVGSDVEFGKVCEDGLEVVLGNEGEVFG